MKPTTARRARRRSLILVALLATFLLVLSGFVVDFGQAFMSKRNLQKAADAGALAGGPGAHPVPGHLRQRGLQLHGRRRGPRRCRRVPPAQPRVLPARVCRDRVQRPLRPGTSGSWWSSTASRARPRPPSARWPAATRPITTDRRAEATVDVAPRANEGVRPLAICSAQLPATRLGTSSSCASTTPRTASTRPAGCPAKTGSRQLVDARLPGGGDRLDLADGQPDPQRLHRRRLGRPRPGGHPDARRAHRHARGRVRRRLCRLRDVSRR